MTPGTGKLKIVVLGYIVRGPIGGMTWHHLNYVLGLSALGHDVLFMEDSDDYPSCYDPSRHAVDIDPTYGLAFAREVFDSAGMGECWCYHDAHTGTWHGPRADDAVAFCADADLVLNISGVNPLRDWTAAIPARAFIDTDPLFTQIRLLQEPGAKALADAHSHFFTFGELIPTGGSKVPEDGRPWIATRQPVDLTVWSRQPPAPKAAFTTVMQWDSYPVRKYGNAVYGMKSRSFEGYFDLPERTDASLALALGGSEAPRERLTLSRWRLDDVLQVTATTGAYQDYIAASKGEWSVAKHGYVSARTGWFSERSACYLASGRPVIVQDTGAPIPGGEGVLYFSHPDAAAVALDEVCANYEQRCDAAREIAETWFATDKVLTQLVEQAGCADTDRKAAYA